MEADRQPVAPPPRPSGLSTVTLSLILVTVILSLAGMLTVTAAAFVARNDARNDAAAARQEAAAAAAETRTANVEATCRADMAVLVDVALIDHAIAQSQLLLDTLTGATNATSAAQTREVLDELLAVREHRDATAEVCNRPTR